MASILLYTAAPDSESTLGGLVELGESLTLGRYLQQALESMRLCGSDPLRSEHRPDTLGRGVHGACCHACQFSPETSGERGNRSALVDAALRSSNETMSDSFSDAVENLIRKVPAGWMDAICEGLRIRGITLVFSASDALRLICGRCSAPMVAYIRSASPVMVSDGLRRFPGTTATTT
jgi:hypothetical protein